MPRWACGYWSSLSASPSLAPASGPGVRRSTTRGNVTGTFLARARQRFIAFSPLAQFEPYVYGLWAASLTLLCACSFYSSMRLQTTLADVFSRPDAFDAATRGALGP